MVIEAEKSHCLLPANWRPRKDKDIIHSKSEGLRIWGANGINSSPKSGEDEMRYLSSSSETEKKRANSFFCSIRPSAD